MTDLVRSLNNYLSNLHDTFTNENNLWSLEMMLSIFMDEVTRIKHMTRDPGCWNELELTHSAECVYLSILKLDPHS